MILLELYSLLIFSTVTISASSPIAIDCTIEGTCFGEPLNCHPDTNCTTLFHYDFMGNLHLFLMNITDPLDYAAFPVQNLPDEIIEYLVCIPQQSRRFRAISELGGLIEVTEQVLTGGVEKLTDDYYRCVFNAEELPERFQDEQHFFVTRGIFDEEVLVIYDGLQLYNLEQLVDYQDEDYYFTSTDASVLPVVPGAGESKVLENGNGNRAKRHQIDHERSEDCEESEETDDEDDSPEEEEDDDEPESEEYEENPCPKKADYEQEYIPQRRSKNRRVQDNGNDDREDDNRKITGHETVVNVDEEYFIPQRRDEILENSEEEEDYIPRRRHKNRKSPSHESIVNENEEYFIPQRRDKNRESREDGILVAHDKDDFISDENQENFVPRRRDKNRKSGDHSDKEDQSKEYYVPMQRNRNRKDRNENEERRHPKKRHIRDKRTFEMNSSQIVNSIGFLINFVVFVVVLKMVF